MVVATTFMPAVDTGNRPAGFGAPLNTFPPTRPTPDLQLGVLFERVLDAIVVARLSTGTIVLWNAAAEKLFGYTADEAIGNSIEMLMPRPIAQVHRAGLARYQRTGHGLIIDADGPVAVPARTRMGEEIRIELTLSEVRDSSGERFALAAMRDATLRKQFELTALELAQARVARSEAEAELAGRDELLATLTSSLENAPSADELQDLVRTLNHFRQLRTGELLLRSVETDLVDIVHAAADDALRQMPRRRLVVRTPPLASVVCDPARMRQVLDQVLGEARRRTRDDARIEVRLEHISAQVIQLSIRSDACGDMRAAGPGLQLSRTLVQRQGGTFTTAISSGGSLEVIMTLPGSPHPPRLNPLRRRG